MSLTSRRSRNRGHAPGRQRRGTDLLLDGVEQGPRRCVLLPNSITSGTEWRFLVTPLHLQGAKLHHLRPVPHVHQGACLQVANHLVGREVGAARGNPSIPVDGQTLPQPVAGMIVLPVRLRLHDLVLLHHASPAMGPDRIPFVDRKVSEEVPHMLRQVRPLLRGIVRKDHLHHGVRRRATVLTILLHE